MPELYVTGLTPHTRHSPHTTEGSPLSTRRAAAHPGVASLAPQGAVTAGTRGPRRPPEQRRQRGRAALWAPGHRAGRGGAGRGPVMSAAGGPMSGAARRGGRRSQGAPRAAAAWGGRRRRRGEGSRRAPAHPGAGTERGGAAPRHRCGRAVLCGAERSGCGAPSSRRGMCRPPGARRPWEARC